MKKIKSMLVKSWLAKSLLAAAAARVLSLGAFAEGLGVYINGTEIGAGTPPEGCGWKLVKSDKITTDKYKKTTERECTVAISKAGTYALTGSNTVDHLHFSIEADCTLKLTDLIVRAEAMRIVHDRRKLTLGNGKQDSSYTYGYYERVYNTFQIGPKKKVSVEMQGLVDIAGSESGILICDSAVVTLSGKGNPTIRDFSVYGMRAYENGDYGWVKAKSSFTGKVAIAGVKAKIEGGTFVHGIMTFEVPEDIKKYGSYVRSVSCGWSAYEGTGGVSTYVWVNPEIELSSHGAFPDPFVTLLGGSFGGDAQTLTMIGGVLTDPDPDDWNTAVIKSLDIRDGVVDMTNSYIKAGTVAISGGSIVSRGGFYASSEKGTLISGGTVYAGGGDRGENYCGGLAGNVTIAGGEVHAEGWIPQKSSAVNRPLAETRALSSFRAVRFMPIGRRGIRKGAAGVQASADFMLKSAAVRSMRAAAAV